jgi:hypothetical protein
LLGQRFAILAAACPEWLTLLGHQRSAANHQPHRRRRSDDDAGSRNERRRPPKPGSSRLASKSLLLFPKTLPVYS